MSTIVRHFKWDDGHYSRFGNGGWLPAWMGNVQGFDPNYGLGVAHDFLEHRLADRGHWHEEVMAFGAMIYTRVLGGYPFYQNDIPRLGEELAGLWLDIEDDPLPTIRQPNLRLRNFDLTRDEHADAGEVVRGLIAGMRDGIDEAVHEGRISDFQRPSELWFEHADWWLRQGYAQACRRYRLGSPMLTQAFNEIMELVDRHYKGEHYGCRLRIEFDQDRFEIKDRLIEPYDSW